MMGNFNIQLSPLDQERFGVVSARANAVSMDHLEEMLEFCHEEQVQFLVARCPSTDVAVAHEMERSGFLLMDTLIYYRRGLVSLPDAAELSGVLIRPAQPGDESAICALAGECFHHYRGHYHADPRLPTKQCAEAYASWAFRSCVEKDMADAVFVAVLHEAIAGFATLKLATPTEGEGLLFGVSPRSRVPGIYRQLMIQAMRWYRSRGAKRMIVSTQITNIAVQTCWVGLGFSPYQSFYTFHRWFEAER